ncbi:hypothetical protein [Bradyrhizobium sp. Tv2a-2]|uniref:hypothetical protein n=1 Tax=Bradyrhizobium sp. Tv2a-2 TaxID=113395 RepID=UPI0004222CB8|nr:hypothetical protein [Bradyrhizobium sp. Tv2a-2]
MSIKTIPAQHWIMCDRCDLETPIGSPMIVPSDWMTIDAYCERRGMSRKYALCSACMQIFDAFFERLRKS